MCGHGLAQGQAHWGSAYASHQVLCVRHAHADTYTDLSTATSLAPPLLWVQVPSTTSCKTELNSSASTRMCCERACPAHMKAVRLTIVTCRRRPVLARLPARGDPCIAFLCTVSTQSVCHLTGNAGVLCACCLMAGRWCCVHTRGCNTCCTSRVCASVLQADVLHKQTGATTTAANTNQGSRGRCGSHHQGNQSTGGCYTRASLMAR